MWFWMVKVGGTIMHVTHCTCMLKRACKCLLRARFSFFPLLSPFVHARVSTAARMDRQWP